MKIIIDCMGGDNAPLEMLKGVIEAKAELGGEYLLVGHRELLETTAREHGLDISSFEIRHGETVITMEDDSMAFRRKKDSSMTLALTALAEGEGDALVSCGNTANLFAGGTLIVRRIKGIHRAALAAVLPFSPPVLLLDCGANVAVQPEFLLQFATMGTLYMRAVYGLESPRVGLLNNGAEEHKGTPVQTEAYRLLKEDAEVCFVGNVEGHQVPFGACDILVTDGYTGNILLKTMEGMGRLFMTRMKGIFSASLLSKLAALTVKGSFMTFKRDMDVKEHGGSPILGLRKPVIKAHGSSDARAFKNAIRQAIRFAESGVIESLERQGAGKTSAEEE